MKKYFILLDFVFVTGSFVAVRGVMVMSPAVNSEAGQWALSRYWIAGIAAALIFVVLLFLNGFYKKLSEPQIKKLPLINLINCGIVFGLGIAACLRYSSVFNGEELISKKILFFSLIATYILTTFSRYILKN